MPPEHLFGQVGGLSWGVIVACTRLAHATESFAPQDRLALWFSLFLSRHKIWLEGWQAELAPIP